MASHHLTSALGIILLAAAAAPVHAQGPAGADLGKRTARSKYALGSIFAMRELADGRVVASDLKEGVFRLVDFNKGEVALLGTQGDDENDYRRATIILDLPGDSIGLVDGAGQKVLHLSAQGALGPMGPLPGAAQHLSPFATDIHGNAYFRASVRDSATKMPSPQSWVTRLTPTGTAPDQIVPYRTRAEDQSVTSMMPFKYTDAIAVRRDGLVARVVADSYRVIWYQDGKEAGRTAPLPYEPIVISDAEKQGMQDSIVTMMKTMTSSMRASGPASAGGATSGATTITFGGAAPIGDVTSGRQMIFTNGGGGTATPIAGPGGTGAPANAAAMMANLDPAKMLGTFPAAKPPIPNAQNVASFDLDGRLWVARSRVRGDVIPHYDIIDQQHGIVGHVNLPAGTRLIGFGKSAVYLARTDDGSEWIERYAMPKM